MYDKILVPMALDHGISPSTLGVAKALCNPGGKIIALHVYEAPHSSVGAYLDKDVVREAFERARTLLAETSGDPGYPDRNRGGPHLSHHHRVFC